MAAPEAVDGEAEKNYEEREGDLTSLSVHEKTERERERERESTLPRERARHLISEIPNIFKSTGAAAPDC